MPRPRTDRDETCWCGWADLAGGILDLFGDLLSEVFSGLLTAVFDT